MAVNGIIITDLTNVGNLIAGNFVMPIVNTTIDETQKTTVQNLGNFILGNLANSLSLTVSNLTVSNNTTLNSANIANANISGNLRIANTVTSNNVVANINVTSDTINANSITANISITTANLNASSTVTSNNIVANNNITANTANILSNLTVNNTALIGNVRTDHLLYANGQPWDLQEAAGDAGWVQYNDGNDNFGASATFVWDSTSNTLNVQNLNLVYANANTNNGTVEQVLGIVDQANQVLGWKTLPTNYMDVYLRNGTMYISSIVPVLRIIPIKARNAPTGYVQIPAA